jgi:RNA polymerase primary sigma factor
MRRRPRPRRGPTQEIVTDPPHLTTPRSDDSVESPDESEEQDRAALDLRQARRELTALISQLPGRCHEFVVREEESLPHSDGSWTCDRLMTCYERLLAFERANEDAEVTAALARAEEIRVRLEQAREALVLAHLSIVPYFIKDYVRGVIPFVDLVQEGYLGLLNAVDRFDPERGKFSTYAYWWIRKAMSNAFTFQVRTIRLPSSVLGELRRQRRVSRELEAELGREPVEREVAQRMKISVKKLRKLASLTPDVSALEDLGTARSGNWSTILPETSIPDPQESILGRELQEQAEEALQLLDPRERAIIRARFGFEDGEGMTRERIGQNLELSSERVRQIERRALEKIYRWAKRNGFRPTRRQGS